jgi:diguanylate cyclase (GGDEF)-like protein
MARIKENLIKIMAFGTVLFLFYFIPQGKAYALESEEHKAENVLILNSYHQGFAWTQEETEGIMDKLKERGNNISFFVEYMDWKNHNSEENLTYLYDYYKYKYQAQNIDIILATDDTALKFALEYRKEMFSDAPVVFCGINREGVKTIAEGHDRVSGVIEVIDPTDTLKIAKSINPGITTVYLLNDNSESGKSTGQIMKEKIKEYDPGMRIIEWNHLTFAEVKRSAEEVPQGGIILLGTYFRDAGDNYLGIDYVTREISMVSSVPVYSVYDFGLNNGIVGGALLSGRRQGEGAAEIAIRILEGADPNQIPADPADSARIVFDYHQLQRFGISASVLPENSEILNKPFSFYETYRTLVLSVAAAFLVLILFVSILLFYIRMIRKMKNNLAESHEELTQLYEELTASDEEMRQQYDEILVINDKIRVSEEKLSYLAYYDSLTGLSNKLSLYEMAKFIFTEETKQAALLFIDIDNFKYANDTLGHAFGDKLIVKVSERLTTLLREDCSLYRLSGDEFIIVMNPIEEKEQAEEYAATLLSDFMNDFDSLNSNLKISLSMGIAIYPEHGSDLEQLLKHADIAMYQAKEAGRKRFVTYNRIMDEAFAERVAMEKYLQKGLEQQEFELYYQPQLSIKTNKITGFEALLRWNSPELGRVSPLKFIKAAEDTHFIIPLGTWVLERACEFLNQLKARGFEELTVSVNISILQLLQADFPDIVNEKLRMYQVEPYRLELEITESILMESFERIASRLQRLRDNKIGIALDDFGKGYSSLNYLKQLPITTMKIDKSFVDHITEGNKEDLVGHIVSIGKDMGMSVVAEGVEHPCQLDYLIEHDCDKIQGFLFCKPVPEAGVFCLLEKHRTV